MRRNPANSRARWAAFGLLSLCLLITARPAEADQAARLIGSPGMDAPPTVTLLDSNPGGLRLEFELPTLAAQPIEVDGETFQAISFPGGAEGGEIGGPSLPVFGRLMAIPARSGIRIETTVLEQREFAGVRPFPVQGEEQAPFTVDRAAYGAAQATDRPVAQVGTPALMRGLRVAPLVFQPVSYGADGDRIRVATRIRVDVFFEGENLVNVADRDPRSTPPSFDRLYRQSVLNYDSQAKSRSIEGGSWLVICRDNSTILNLLQPLVNWRERTGRPVHVATTSEAGTTANSIKTYILNAYLGWENPPEFVVLVGDATGSYSIPTWFETESGYSGEGDLPYAQLEGNDILPDLHVGRLSIQNTTHLETMVAKILDYEMNPSTSDPGWFTRACLVGDPYDSGYSTIMLQQWVKTRLREIGYTQIDTIWSGNFASQMLASLNQGDSIFSYRGFYWMSGWNNSYIYQMTNYNKLPFAIFSTCDTGSFADDNECRSEAFLRVGSSSSIRGAIGAVGTATSGTHTRFNNCFTMGVWKGALYEDLYEIGAALDRGKVELYLNYNATQPWYASRFAHWNSLMGDPATPLWTAYPQVLSVDHPSSVPVGANSFAVTVSGDGQSVEGAKVCLLKGEEIHTVGYTDAGGTCELIIQDVTAGDLLLTITGHNLRPYLQTVPVQSEDLFVGFRSCLIDDDNQGESQGNGDQQVNPGETIELRVSLRNYGEQTAPDVTALLTCDDPYVTILDGEESFGDMGPDYVVWSQDDFRFFLDPACPHGRTLRFGLEVNSGAEQWHSLIEIPALSAELDHHTHGFFVAGDNGLLDPGETVRLSVTLRNDGGMPAEEVTGTLVSLSQYLSVPGPVCTFGSIAVGGTGTNTAGMYQITADADCPAGYSAMVRIFLDFSDGVKDTTDFWLDIGTASSDDPLGPDRYGYYAYDNTDTSYPEAPVYNWIEIDPSHGGNGTQVTLGDYSKHQDKSRTVDLPFAFRYYGQDFTKATICSNGWVSMGSTYLVNYRNWIIPGVGAPPNMLACFWDDLYEHSGGKVYQKYDAANHRWIVQWSRMRNNAGGGYTTCQAILYDPVHHPTDSGDGIIEFQYLEVSNIDATDGYCTVGIQNRAYDDGLCYTFFNVYPASAAVLTSGRAIRFVPKVETLTGFIQGTAYAGLGTDRPISGVTVRIEETEDEFLTNIEGKFQTEEFPGTYTLTASKTGFAPDSLFDVQVLTGQTTPLEFHLHDILPPGLQYSNPLPSTSDSLGPYMVSIMASDFSGLDEVAVYYRHYDGDFRTLEMEPQGLNYWSAGIPGQPWTSRIDYYILVRDGAGNVRTSPARAPEELYTFWVAPLITSFADDFETAGDWGVGSAEDTATEGVWEQVDPNGTFSGEEPVQPEDDRTPDPGVLCWVTGNADPGSDQDAGDVEGGLTTLTSPLMDLAIDGEVLLRYWRWFTNDTGDNPGEDEWVVQVSNDDGAGWVDLERTTESAREWRLMEFNLGEILTLTSQMRIRFRAADENGPSIVEAAVDDVEIVYFGLTPASVEETAPAGFGFLRGLTNPLRPGSGILFSLEQAGPARLTVYDVQGRAVRRMVDGALPEGPHRVAWDGRDDGGRLLSTGIYFYRLESGARSEVRKALVIH